MRKLLLIVLVALLVFAFPAIALAADTGPPGVLAADTLFGLDLATAAVLLGAVVALSAYAHDVLNVDGWPAGWRRSGKLLVVFSVGVGVGSGLLGLTFLQSALIAAAAAGYYKLAGST